MTRFRRSYRSLLIAFCSDDEQFEFDLEEATEAYLLPTSIAFCSDDEEFDLEEARRSYRSLLIAFCSDDEEFDLEEATEAYLLHFVQMTKSSI